MAPHLRCWLPSHPHPQPLGTQSPCLPVLCLFTESTSPSRPPPSTPPHPQGPPTHPGLSLFTFPRTPQPSDVTRLPIKPADFGILCSVSGALCICCPSNGGVPSQDPPRPLPILSTQEPTCPQHSPTLSPAVFQVPAGESAHHPTPPHPSIPHCLPKPLGSIVSFLELGPTFLPGHSQQPECPEIFLWQSDQSPLPGCVPRLGQHSLLSSRWRVWKETISFPEQILGGKDVPVTSVMSVSARSRDRFQKREPS